MKILLKIGIVFCLGITLLQVASCHKEENPVDKYVAILEETINSIENVKSQEDLLNLKPVINQEEAITFLRESSDYKLTDRDKEKLKAAEDKLMRATFEKTKQFGILPVSSEEDAKTQMDMVISVLNEKIDQAKTLGDLNRINQ